MKIFKYRTFHKWAYSEGINDEDLKEVAHEIEAGLYDANLGSGLYKKRLRRKGQGKRNSYRTLIAFKQNTRTFFIYGFAKNERDNISQRESIVYKRLAQYYLNMPDSDLTILVKNGEVLEVTE